MRDPNRAITRAAVPAAALLAAILLGPSPVLAGEPISFPAEQAIRNLVKSYTEVWKTGLHRRILSHLTEDAVLMPHHGATPVEGKDAIDRFWWPDEGEPTGVSLFDIEPDEVYGEGDLAYLRGRFALEYWIGLDEARRTFRTEGNWLGIFTRNSQGRWLMHRVIWNDPEAIETTAGVSSPAGAQ